LDLFRFATQGSLSGSKRSSRTDRGGARAGYGKNTLSDKQQKDVTILDIFENAASVKVVAADWIHYLHMAKFNGKWVIVNVLRKLKPRPA